LWHDTENFLKEKGYIKVDEPQDYDVVVYRRTESKDPFGFFKRTEAKHFGIYEDGKVISKFGSGSIYIHDLDMVEPDYGDEVLFFRKMK